MGVEPPVTEPPAVTGLTTIVMSEEYTEGQDPLCTMARYSHVPTLAGISEYVVLVLAILTHPPETSLLSHLTIVPVNPVKVMVPVEDPRQMGDEPPVTFPGTVSGVSVTAKVREGEGNSGAPVYWLTTLTVRLPAVPPIFAVISFVPCPPVIVHPAGTVQRYSVAPPKGMARGSDACLLYTSDAADE